MLNKVFNILRSDVMIVYCFDMLAKAITFLLSVVIIRNLCVKDYAQYTLFYSIGNLIPGILGGGIGLAYTRYAVMLREQTDNADTSLFIALKRCIYKLVITISIISLIIFYITNNLVSILHLFGICYGLIMSLYQINIVFFQAREQYSIGGILYNIKNLSIAISILICFYILYVKDLYIILTIYILAVLLSYLGASIFIRQIIRTSYPPTSCFNGGQLLRNMFKDSIWTVLYMGTLNAFNQIDVMLLTYFCNAEQVAIYGVANKYYLVAISLLPALLVVLRVRYSKGAIVNDVQQQRKTVTNWLKRSVPFAFVFAILASVTSKLTFPYLNGEVYNDAIITFNILVIGVALNYVTAPNVSLMISTGKQKILFILSIGSFLLNVIGNLLLIPYYGANAAALTTILAHFFLNGGSTLYLLLRKDRNKVQNK